ncbi:MAG: ATP-binding cassette domain-containing protein [Clostridia bacterium]|nr:ATP-binding cassette domain-containing protein [Clostridia bacterium]
MVHGKSTMFRCIMNIYEKDSGEILLNGKKITSSTLDKVGFLIEEGCLTAEYTVYEQFSMFGILKNMTDDEITDSLLYWLNKFGISEYLNTKIKKISKGNKQKLQFIVAVMHNPDLIILDEPFSGLDPLSSAILKNVILELKKQGKIIIFSSHQMENVESLCDDIFMISHGKEVLYGNLNDIKNEMDKKKIRVVGKIDKDKIKCEEIYNITEDKLDTYDIYVNGSENTSKVIEALKEYDIKSIIIDNLSLEDIFMEKAGVKYESE